MKNTQTNRIKEAIQSFRKYCVEKGMRYTLEREMIIREIYRSEGHFNVDKLFARIKVNNPTSKIAKTSVYRSVPYFLDAGLLRESVAGAGQVIYERTLGDEDHDHFRCIGCGKIGEFYSPELEFAQKAICSKEKFKVLWRTNVTNGYCERCASKQS